MLLETQSFHRDNLGTTGGSCKIGGGSGKALPDGPTSGHAFQTCVHFVTVTVKFKMDAEIVRDIFGGESKPLPANETSVANNAATQKVMLLFTCNCKIALHCDIHRLLHCFQKPKKEFVFGKKSTGMKRELYALLCSDVG